jgi:GH24 family phage-related lysozyme (muramidase)
MIDGKPVKLGMHFTVDECNAMMRKRMIHDYYLPLVDNVKDFVKAPDSVQGAALDVAYNVGTGAITKKTSTAGKAITDHDYQKACAGLTLFNRAGGKVLPGLDNRRKMGDKTREGEAEVCLNTEVK